MQTFQKSWMPIGILVVGLALMAGKIYADSEPGAVPLLLVVVGAVWCAATRFRSRAGRQDA